MGFIKKNLLKVIEWKDDSKDTVAYRFPIPDRYAIMNGSVLTVRESQVALFVYKGEIQDVFEPGTYKLSTENIPFLSKILALPYAFELPIQAEVYYVNTKQFTGQKWGTQNPIAIRDKDFGAIRLRGYGVYAFRVVDAKAFMKEMLGTNASFKTSDVAEQLRPMIISAITDTIAESKISLLDLAASYKEFGQSVVNNDNADFAQYGIKLEKLVVENLSLPENVEKALDKRSELGIMEDKVGTYTQLQAAEAMRDAAKNPGGNSFAGLGVGLGVAGTVGNMYRNSLTTEDKPKQRTKTCVKCGAEIPEKAKHCPECGTAQDATCPKCGEVVSKTAKFCPNCGENLNKEITCAKCGEKLKSTSKFCPNCGEKVSK